jgi:hypothetical protein
MVQTFIHKTSYVKILRSKVSGICYINLIIYPESCILYLNIFIIGKCFKAKMAKKIFFFELKLL